MKQERLHLEVDSMFKRLGPTDEITDLFIHSEWAVTFPRDFPKPESAVAEPVISSFIINYIIGSKQY